MRHDTYTTSPAILAIVLALLMPTDALAQSRTFYGADGRVTSCAATSGNTTTIYGANGRKAGSILDDGGIIIIGGFPTETIRPMESVHPFEVLI